jgi:predicted flap endonuclease-1-like 5' DNA nuclease
MTLFVLGLFAGGIVGWALARLFTYEADPALANVAPAAALVRGQEQAEDDLQQIEGVGPKIAELLRADGIRSFGDLAAADTPRLQSLLDAAGPRFKLAQPDTWVAQAKLAAAGDWAALRVLKDNLTGGVDRRAA